MFHTIWKFKSLSMIVVRSFQCHYIKSNLKVNQKSFYMPIFLWFIEYKKLCLVKRVCLRLIKQMEGPAFLGTYFYIQIQNFGGGSLKKKPNVWLKRKEGFYFFFIQIQQFTRILIQLQFFKNCTKLKHWLLTSNFLFKRGCTLGRILMTSFWVVGIFLALNLHMPLLSLWMEYTFYMGLTIKLFVK